MTMYCSRPSHSRERGYVLLLLLLSVALLSIAFTVLIQGIEFEIRRDREEELIHRGVQYSRAVRKYIKAFGRYPNSVEELENTNNIRFLRKRYKDPITGKEFKILRLMDLPGSKPLTGAVSVARMASPQNSTSVANDAAEETSGASAANGGSDPQTSSSDDESVALRTNQSQPDGSDPMPRTPQSPTGDSPNLRTQRFGGGPMVGVVSLSKRTTIREFDKKNHYNEWQFVYDPSTDRGGLLMTPNQPLRAARLDNAQNEQTSLHALGANSSYRSPADRAQGESPTLP